MLLLSDTEDKHQYTQATTDPGSSTDQRTIDIFTVNGTEAINISKTESAVSM